MPVAIVGNMGLRAQRNERCEAGAAGHGLETEGARGAGDGQVIDDLLLFVAIGFAAQIVDGAIGMAYGLTASTVLLGFGVTPAAASASVHAAEVFTTGASGLSHWRFGNVDRGTFLRLAAAGMVGGAIGAYLLAMAPPEIVRPIVNLYLALMGGVVLWRAVNGKDRPPSLLGGRQVAGLGFVGGALDAAGGGGWGPLVTSSLVAHGMTPKLAIGSSNAAEFFIATVVSATFLFTIGIELWPAILGLVLGGVLAAPFAAYATSKLPDRPLMILVGAVIMILSIRGLLQSVLG